MLMGINSVRPGGEMERVTSQPNPTFCYGDFPELFWDAQPDVAIDVQNPVTLARLLTRGRAEVIGKLVPLEVLRERLDALSLPEHVRIFWRAVLRSAPRAAPGATVLQEDW
jgi:hypothetical protein